MEDVAWKFREYVAPSGRKLVSEWYGKLSLQIQSDFDRMLGILANKKEWKYPEFKRLQGRQYRGLGEIRWQSGGVQHRVIGCNGSGAGEYTLLIGCTHKGRVYDPPSALGTAIQRMRALKDGQGTTCRYES